jgi:hypothetical protein
VLAHGIRAGLLGFAFLVFVGGLVATATSASAGAEAHSATTTATEMFLITHNF